ncbi:MBL fold metallo-hydrolase [Candidatus Poriferisodalis sp.]|uniref:MBL fold metallo-hydrolase n=1 Tax=Candidatus Poriferisodalis sp. TaxID=3101277 RepID=UPI003C703152
MARADMAHTDNVDGPWFVDTRCIRCDVARHWAPGLIEMDDSGLSYLARQPESPAETAALWRAAEACPTQSIGNLDIRRPPIRPFPYELTPGVLALGHNARSSFGAHSYLVERPDGNLMVDSPRYLRGLAEGVDDLGGIRHVLLSHRDDVADADRWAERYGAEVWIHAADADAAPYATVILDGDDPALISPGIVAIPVPGHTEGSVVFHVDDRWLFTGDTLHWNHRRHELDVFPEQTFHSWDELAGSMDLLSTLRVEWVFAGHGSWNDVGTDLYADQMSSLGDEMRQTGRAGWAQRPLAAYDWY